MHKKLISTKLIDSLDQDFYWRFTSFRFFLQHPANPDLLYIIFFCHSQLTITILLCLIFASKVGCSYSHCDELFS